MAVEEGATLRETSHEGLVNGLGGEGGGERQVAGGKTFGEAEEIGHDTLGLSDGERAEATEAGEDFVEDEMDPVLAAEVGHGGCEAGRLLDHAGGALDAWLEDEAGQALAFGVEQCAESGEGR